MKTVEFIFTRATCSDKKGVFPKQQVLARVSLEIETEKVAQKCQFAETDEEYLSKDIVDMSDAVLRRLIYDFNDFIASRIEKELSTQVVIRRNNVIK